MGMILDTNSVVFEKKVYENELEALKSHLNGIKSGLNVDLTACVDLHGSIIQLLLSYKAVHDCTFAFNDESSTFKLAIEGFRNVENNCH